MAELRDVVERAARAVETIQPPAGGMGRLREARRRRHRHRRIEAGVVALLVSAAGVFGSIALLRSLGAPAVHRPGGGTVSPPAGATPPPTGEIAQRAIGGRPAQRLGPFWFGVREKAGCLAAGPLAIGPSWTFADGGHECLTPLASARLRVGRATGTVHEDGATGPATTFGAVYGLAGAGTARVDVTWTTGGVASVRPVHGRFLLVWSGEAVPATVTAIAADGRVVASVEPV